MNPNPLPPDSDPAADSRFAGVVARLRNAPAPAPSADFADRVLAAALASGVPARPRAYLFLLKAAAVLALLLGGTLAWRALLPSAASPSAAAPRDALGILLAAQRPDGAWGPSPAPHRYDPAVTALALLAIARHDANPLASPRAEAFSSGVASLLRAQRPDGSFAAAPDAAYLAFQALRAAHDLPGAPPEWAEALLRAAPSLPPPAQVAALNRRLAHPPAAPSSDPWLLAGGPAAAAAVELIRN